MPAAPTPEIGPVIQRHRKARGLTLEQFADLSGVSKSMLSQIERGQANPTFAVLWSLTRALGIDFTDLIDGAAADDPIEIVSRLGTPEVRSLDGLCRLRIFSPPHMAGLTEWYGIEIAPAGVLDSSSHAPGAVEHLTVFDGALDVTSAATTRTVAAGETARYPADADHRIANTAAAPARGLLVVVFK